MHCQPTNFAHVARLSYHYDTRSFADVAKRKPCKAIDVATELSQRIKQIEEYDASYVCCSRAINYMKVMLLIYAAENVNKLRFFNTHWWRSFFYTIRGRIDYFYANRVRLKSMKCTCDTMYPPPRYEYMYEKFRCTSQRDDREQVNKLAFCRRRFHGAHCQDFEVFMHLSLRMKLGNDIAGHVFDFL